MFVNWEGRVRPFGQAMRVAGALPDLRALAGIAQEMGAPLGFSTVAEARAEMEAIGPWDGPRVGFDTASPSGSAYSTNDSSGDRVAASASPSADRVAASASEPRIEIKLATWKQSIDDGRMQDGDKYLHATARPPIALLPQALYDAHGPTVTLTGDRGSMTLPARPCADMVERTVWVPAASAGAGVLSDLASPGSTVTISGGSA